MTRPSFGIAAVFLLALSLALTTCPHEADARAGGGRSMGSMGSHTYSPSYSAQPISRSATSPQYRTQPAYSQSPAYAPTTSSHPFLHGLVGGFLGASIASMLFGHPVQGSGFGILPLLLFGGVIFFIFRRASWSTSFSYGAQPDYGFNAMQQQSNEQPVYVNDSDKAEFSRLFYGIQQSWSAGDIAHLRQYVTPEMLQYFNEDLSANSSRGFANKVEQVQLQNAQMLEAWQEDDGMEYATARLQWTALDYMVRLDRQPSDADYIASGSHSMPEPAQEVWTFTRAPGGHWLLSAIQQST